jgi:hypothetical protein
MFENSAGVDRLNLEMLLSHEARISRKQNIFFPKFDIEKEVRRKN